MNNFSNYLGLLVVVNKYMMIHLVLLCYVLIQGYMTFGTQKTAQNFKICAGAIVTI